MSDLTLSRLGQRIRNLRIKAGLTQEQLAEQADFHPTYLGGIERGERNPALQNISQLARALEVSLPELFAFEKTGVKAGSRRSSDKTPRR